MIAAARLWTAERFVMGPDAPQNVGVSIDHKGKAIASGEASFPDLAAFHIELAFHLFGSFWLGEKGGGDW